MYGNFCGVYRDPTDADFRLYVFHPVVKVGLSVENREPEEVRDIKTRIESEQIQQNQLDTIMNNILVKCGTRTDLTIEDGQYIYPHKDLLKEFPEAEGCQGYGLIAIAHGQGYSLSYLCQEHAPLFINAVLKQTSKDYTWEVKQYLDRHFPGLWPTFETELETITDFNQGIPKLFPKTLELMTKEIAKRAQSTNLNENWQSIAEYNLRRLTFTSMLFRHPQENGNLSNLQYSEPYYKEIPQSPVQRGIWPFRWIEKKPPIKN